MLPGEVVSIRINPADCMAIVDVMNAAGLSSFAKSGASFSSVVSLVLRSLLEGARQQGSIPTRDGFEYSEMMAPFICKKRGKRKLEINSVITFASSDLKIKTIPTPDQQPAKQAEPYIHTEAELGIIRYKKQILAQMQELQDKHDLDPVNFDDSQRAEYDRLEAKLNSL